MSKKLSFLAMLIMLTGVVIRCAHFFLFDIVHEPYRLGGLFIAFADEIARHNFQFPVTIPYYSVGGIPFAYPPLGFYVQAVFLKIFPERIFLIANLLPPLISVLTLGVAAWCFYQWAGAWTLKSLSAMTAYALLPNAFYNQVEAAGLAESFGSLALIVYFNTLIRYQERKNAASAILAGCALALCVISSPGSALGSALISLVFVLDTLIAVGLSDKLKPYLHLLLLGVIGIVLSAPYWLSVILNHGAGIFLNSTGMQFELSDPSVSTSKFGYLWFTFSALQLDGVFFWTITTFMGLVWMLSKRNFFIPLAFLAMFCIPRENTWLTAFPAAWLVACGIADVLYPVIKSLSIFTPVGKSRFLGVSLVLIALSMTLQAFELMKVQAINEYWKLEPDRIEALQKAREIIPASAQVIVLGNGGLREWSPYLLRREVLNTEFGLEWEPEEYHKIMSANQQLDGARNWQDIENSIKLLTDIHQIYIVSENGKISEYFQGVGADEFVVKMQVPGLQVSVITLP